MYSNGLELLKVELKAGIEGMVHRHPGSAAPLLGQGWLGSATGLPGSLVKSVPGSAATHTSSSGIVSGHQGARSPQSVLSSWQSQPWGLTAAVPELPAAQRGYNTPSTVWISVRTELTMAYQPRYTHSQVSFL